jgi:hypothetical protein
MGYRWTVSTVLRRHEVLKRYSLHYPQSRPDGKFDTDAPQERYGSQITREWITDFTDAHRFPEIWTRIFRIFRMPEVEL